MNEDNNKVRIKRIVSWTIPTFGNCHTIPYGKLLVTDGETEKVVSTKGDTLDTYERFHRQYITFKRKHYEVVTYADGKHEDSITLKPFEQ